MASLMQFVFQKKTNLVQTCRKPQVIFGNAVVFEDSIPVMPKAISRESDCMWPVV